MPVSTPSLGHYGKVKRLTNRSIFRITKEDLTLFFNKRNIRQPDNQGECRISLNILKDCGYNQGLCTLLNTNKDTGIIGDSKDIERRQIIYGKHSIALPKVETFWNLLARNFEDINVIILIWSATVYLLFSMFSKSQTAYIESLTIYSGLLLSACISAFCDWIKERQYLKLKDEINNQTVNVIRGAYGTVTRIPVRDLVVGDIVHIQAGDRVPADCILVEEMNIHVDQSMYNPNEKDVLKEESIKYEDDNDNHKEHPDPFLFTDSKVMNGNGKALVCAVGQQTLLARSRAPGDLKIEEQQTELEKKLEKTAKQISKYAMLATFLSVVTHLVFLIVVILFGERTLFSNDTLLSILNICIIAVVLMIVAIPEGLPLAVSIAMALSISRLKDDEILIKNLESIQSCAMLHDLCVGKTGTITKGKLNVGAYQIGDQMQTYKHERDALPDAFNTKYEIHNDMKQWVKECILMNTDVYFETNEKEYKYEPNG